MVALNINHHHVSPQGVETTIDVGETKGFHHLSSHHLPQTRVLRVTGTHHQHLPLCHPGLIDQTDPSVPNEGDSTKGIPI